MLIHLISDLVRDAKLRNGFAKSPARVVKSYHLPKEVRKLLKDGDRGKIEAQLRAEVTQMLDGLSAKEPVLIPYPGCEPAVDSISPRIVGPDIPTSFAVVGGCFVEDDRTAKKRKPVKLYFERPGTRVDATNVKVSDDHAKLTGTATFTVSGTYDVIVENPDGNKGTLAGGLTVT